MTKIILLDVDGVLVHPGGYRAALRATLNHFIDPPFEVQEENLLELEKRGISSEWDMAPLLLAAYWSEILSRQSGQNLPTDVFSAAIAINQRKIQKPAQLSIPEIRLVAGQYPAETAFQAGYFSYIPFGLRKNLLTQTRNVQASRTMRVFQHFTLGSKEFTETYDLPAEFQTGSFLLKYDKSNLTEEIRSSLSNPDYHLAAFTSRPSKPPCEIQQIPLGYAPEAELALELVGLPHIPLMAFGKLEYLSAQFGLDPASLVKPSPFHALAAILAAWTGEEWLALQAAYHWLETGTINKAFRQLPKTFELIVVEDTMGGVHSVHAAGKILKDAGFNVDVRAIGLTSGNVAKAAAFESAGVPSYEDWNSLMEVLER
jgi:phosphoglycolate phosphatase-like HAD superfamily hydrolase